MSNQIRLKHIQVTELSLKIDTFDKNVTNKLETTFGFATGFNADNNKDFAIIFDLGLQNEEQKFRLNLKATAHFETDIPITDDFKESSFVKISAPAIAFPYIRTYVSNLTLNSGYEAIMLPSFNFIKIAEDMRNDLDNEESRVNL